MTDPTTLRFLSRPDLLTEYALLVSRLTSLIEQIAFLRVEELRQGRDGGGAAGARGSRMELEGERDILTETKFLIVQLLIHHADRNEGREGVG